MGSLKVGDAEAIEIDGKILDGFTTIDKVLESMKERKLTLAHAPEDDFPLLPEDMNNVDNQALGTLYSRLLAWYNFLVTEMALAHSIQTQEKNRLAYIKAKLKKELGKKEDIDTHPLMIKSTIQRQEAEQRFLMIEAMYKALSKNLATVSRSIELRKMTFQSENRESAIGRSHMSRTRDAEEDLRWRTRDE